MPKHIRPLLIKNPKATTQTTRPLVNNESWLHKGSSTCKLLRSRLGMNRACLVHTFAKTFAVFYPIF